MKCASLLWLLLVGPLLTAQSFAQTTLYKCPSCGRYHERVATNTVQPAAQAVVAKAKAVSPNSEVQTASAVGSASATTEGVQTASATRVVPSPAAEAPQRWRFHNATKWTRRIDPNAQAWAQQEANRLAQRRYSGYLQNGHPGGNNPYASVTGTGTTFVGADLIHTCEGSNGMTLVAEAAAVSSDGRIYGVRSWR